MVQASLLGGFRNPFELVHVPSNKTVNAWAFLGAGQTSLVHCVVFPRLTWLCVASPAPSLLSCFHPSWRAAFMRNPVLLSVLGSLVSRGLFREPCSLEAQSNSPWARHSPASISQRCEPTSSQNGSPSKGRDLALTLRGKEARAGLF